MTPAETLRRCAENFLSYVKYYVYIEDRDEAQRAMELAYSLEKALKDFEEVL